MSQLPTTTYISVSEKAQFGPVQQQYNLKAPSRQQMSQPSTPFVVDASFGDISKIGMGQSESFIGRPWEASRQVAYAGQPMQASGVRCPPVILSQPQGLAKAVDSEQCNYLFPEVGFSQTTPVYNIRF